VSRDLALAAFAAETGTHVVREPKDERFKRFLRGFDAKRFLACLSACGIRFLGLSDPRFPPLLRQLHDPPPGLFLRGSATEPWRFGALAAMAIALAVLAVLLLRRELMRRR